MLAPRCTGGSFRWKLSVSGFACPRLPLSGRAVKRSSGQVWVCRLCPAGRLASFQCVPVCSSVFQCVPMRPVCSTVSNVASGQCLLVGLLLACWPVGLLACWPVGLSACVAFGWLLCTTYCTVLYCTVLCCTVLYRTVCTAGATRVGCRFRLPSQFGVTVTGQATGQAARRLVSWLRPGLCRPQAVRPTALVAPLAGNTGGRQCCTVVSGSGATTRKRVSASESQPTLGWCCESTVRLGCSFVQQAASCPSLLCQPENCNERNLRFFSRWRASVSSVGATGRINQVTTTGLLPQPFFLSQNNPTRLLY